MSDKQDKSWWWQTVPGILTGIAAIITAVGGVVAIAYQGGLIGRHAPLATSSGTPQEEGQTRSLDRTEPAPNLPPLKTRGNPSPPVGFRSVQAGHYVFKLLDSSIAPHSINANGKPSKLSMRFSIRVTDVMGVSDYIDRRTIRLSADGAELLPENTINVAVYDNQSIQTDAVFIVPTDVDSVELLVGRPEDATARIPITFEP